MTKKTLPGSPTDDAHTIARQITEQILSILEKRDAKNGHLFSEDIEINLLGCLVAGVLYRELMRKPPQAVGKQELYEFTRDNVARVKDRVQQAIAVGFQSAMATYSGKHTDYYCLIRVTPEPVNKTPC